MKTSNQPDRVLPGASMLPPMVTALAANGSSIPKQKRNGKPHQGDRFGVLNAFVDCTMADLTRAEIAVWMVLYRDMRSTRQKELSEQFPSHVVCAWTGNSEHPFSRPGETRTPDPGIMSPLL